MPLQPGLTGGYRSGRLPHAPANSPFCSAGNLIAAQDRQLTPSPPRSRFPLSIQVGNVNYKNCRLVRELQRTSAFGGSFRHLSAFAALLCAGLFLGAAQPLRAGDDWLPIPPDDLKMTADPHAPGAQAIYLYRQVDRNDQLSVETDYIRIKIFTEEGRKQGDVEIRYLAAESNIRNIKARTIHPDGAVINFDGKVYDKVVIKARGFKYAAKTFTLPDVQVGSIIEYRYTVEEDPHYVYFSHWILNEDLFTRRAKFSVKLNEQFVVRWIGQRLPPGVALPKDAPDRTVRLEVANLPAFQEEDFMPPETEVRSLVDFIYTSNQDVEKTKYWKSENKRMYDNAENFVGKHKEIALLASELAPPNDPPELRLRKLYQKVQSFRNTTYELQKTEQERKREKEKVPDSVVDIIKKSAGNRLQLTWLYLALVRGAGFQAYAVAVPTRDRYFFNPDSMNSSLLSNVVVLVKDGATDRYFDPGGALTPFGFLPWAESEVVGLRLDKEGGTWVKTPLSPSADSRIIRKAAFKLTTEGALEGKLSLTFTGLEAREQRIEEMNEDDTHRKTYLERLVQSYVPVGCEAELTNKPDWSSSSPEFLAEFNLKIPGWASAAGRRAVMPVGVFSASEKHLFEHSSRTSPIYFSFPFQTADDITIELPAGWRIGNPPAPQKTDKKMLVYENSVEEKAGVLHLTRTLAVNGIFLEVQYYSSLRTFFQYLKNVDDQQLIVLPGAAGGQN